MTPRRTFVYRQRSRESVEHVQRLHHEPAWDWDQAMRLAYHGQPARLCALLRANGLDDLADLLEWLRPARRRIPPSVDAFDRQGHVRRHEKRYGKRNSNGELLYGERQKSVDGMLRALIEMGELRLKDKRAIAAWRKAQELCQRLEREAEADEEMSLEQYRRKIRPGTKALREAMCQDHDIEKLREKLVGKLNHDAKQLKPSPATSPTPEQTASSASLREAFAKAIAGKPRFQEAKKSGKAIVIAGSRPSPPSK
jgi:hypothetical protein